MCVPRPELHRLVLRVLRAGPCLLLGRRVTEVRRSEAVSGMEPVAERTRPSETRTQTLQTGPLGGSTYGLQRG